MRQISSLVLGVILLMSMPTVVWSAKPVLEQSEKLRQIRKNLASGHPTLIYFTKPWCPNDCNRMNERVLTLMSQRPDMTVIFVDVESYQDLFEIGRRNWGLQKEVPGYLLSSGQTKSITQGSFPLAALESWVETYIPTPAKEPQAPPVPSKVCPYRPFTLKKLDI